MNSASSSSPAVVFRPCLRPALLAMVLAALGFALRIWRADEHFGMHYLYLLALCFALTEAQRLFLLAILVWSAEPLARRWLIYGLPLLVLAAVEGGFMWYADDTRDQWAGALFAILHLVLPGVLLWLPRIAFGLRIAPPDAERPLSLRDCFGLTTIIAARLGGLQIISALIGMNLYIVLGWRTHLFDVAHDIPRVLTVAAILGLTFHMRWHVRILVLLVVACVLCGANIALYAWEGDAWDSVITQLTGMPYDSECYRSLLFTLTLSANCAFIRQQGGRLLVGRSQQSPVLRPTLDHVCTHA